MLNVGQTLWWIDHNTQTEGTVTVHSVETTHFSVLYKGKIYCRPYSAINSTLFYTSQLSKAPVQETEKCCEACFYRHSGDCTSLSNVLCEDYRARQVINKEETDSWPTYGDATAYRIKKRKPIKKEKW